MDAGQFHPPQDTTQPFQPGQFQPPNYNPPPPPYNRPQPQPHNYRGWTLVALVIGYLAALIMVSVDALVMSGPSSSNHASSSGSSLGVVGFFGTFLLILLNIFIIIKDGRSFFTLFGKIQWKRMNVLLRICLGFVYLCGWIMSAIYIILAIRRYLRASQQTLGVALHRGWAGYRRRNRVAQVGLALACAFLLFSFFLCTVTGAVTDRSIALGLLTPTTSPQQVVVPTRSPTSNSVSNAAATTMPTATPTTAPTATPTPTQPPPTPTPRPTPTPTPVPHLSITFTCASATDYSYGQVCVHTLAGAALTITVTYCSGYDATSASLQGTSYADGGGNHTWGWTPQTKCRGQATAYVNASWNGQSVSNSTNFNVQ